MLAVTKDTFAEEIVRAEKPIVVDFWGPQCAPCLALEPKMEALEKEYGNRIKITKVEAHKNRRLCLSLKVLSLPTFLFYKDGGEVGRLTGDVTIESVKEAIEGML
jgi:thioredoxin 1